MNKQPRLSHSNNSFFNMHRTSLTDIGLRSRFFSLKISKLSTFSEITQAWECLKIVFIRSDEFT